MKVGFVACVLTCVVGIAGCGLEETAPPVNPLAGLHAGKTADLTAAEQAVEDVLKRSAALPVCASYFAPFFSKAYLVIGDFDDLCFTVTIADGKTTISRGIDLNACPDIVIPLSRDNCEGIFNILEDGKVTDEEEYRIFRVTFVPSYRSLLMQPEMHDPAAQRFLDMPDIIHVTLKNDAGHLYEGRTRPLTATIVKTEGQWIVAEGAHGVPELSLAVSVKDAKAFTELLRSGIALKDAPKAEKKAYLARVKASLDAMVVARR